MRESSRIRVFAFRYRKVAQAMVREKECNCDGEERGSLQAGDIWHYESGDDVWVKVAVAFFPNPTTEIGRGDVDTVFGRAVEIGGHQSRGDYPARSLQ